MSEFFTNSWVISIVTGLLVYGVTKGWEYFRARKQYRLSVSLANKEVFDTIKYTIPEETLPSVYVLKALHASTAKRQNVKQKDMDSLNSILFDLIKEIMDSNFLAYENKLRYCENLEKLEKSLIENSDDEENTKDGEENIRKKLRHSYISASATLLAITSSFIAFTISTFSDSLSGSLFTLDFYDFLIDFAPQVLSLFTLLIFALFVLSKIRK